MPNQSSTLAPCVVAEWPKGPNEVVRVCLQNYKGHPVINIRVWYQSRGDETLRPGTNGISLAVTHVAKIRKALKKAEQMISKAGEGDDA